MKYDGLGSNCSSNDRAAAASQDGRLGIKSFGRQIGSFDLNFSEMPLKYPGDVR